MSSKGPPKKLTKEEKEEKLKKEQAEAAEKWFEDNPGEGVKKAKAVQKFKKFDDKVLTKAFNDVNNRKKAAEAAAAKAEEEKKTKAVTAIQTFARGIIDRKKFLELKFQKGVLNKNEVAALSKEDKKKYKAILAAKKEEIQKEKARIKNEKKSFKDLTDVEKTFLEKYAKSYLDNLKKTEEEAAKYEEFRKEKRAEADEILMRLEDEMDILLLDDDDFDTVQNFAVSDFNLIMRNIQRYTDESGAEGGEPADVFGKEGGGSFIRNIVDPKTGDTVKEEIKLPSLQDVEEISRRPKTDVLGNVVTESQMARIRRQRQEANDPNIRKQRLAEAKERSLERRIERVNPETGEVEPTRFAKRRGLTKEQFAELKERGKKSPRAGKNLAQEVRAAPTGRTKDDLEKMSIQDIRRLGQILSQVDAKESQVQSIIDTRENLRNLADDYMSKLTELAGAPGQRQTVGPTPAGGRAPQVMTKEERFIIQAAFQAQVFDFDNAAQRDVIRRFFVQSAGMDEATADQLLAETVSDPATDSTPEEQAAEKQFAEFLKPKPKAVRQEKVEYEGQPVRLTRRDPETGEKIFVGTKEKRKRIGIGRKKDTPETRAQFRAVSPAVGANLAAEASQVKRIRPGRASDIAALSREILEEREERERFVPQDLPEETSGGVIGFGKPPAIVTDVFGNLIDPTGGASGGPGGARTPAGQAQLRALGIDIGDKVTSRAPTNVFVATQGPGAGEAELLKATAPEQSGAAGYVAEMAPGQFGLIVHGKSKFTPSLDAPDLDVLTGGKIAEKGSGYYGAGTVATNVGGNIRGPVTGTPGGGGLQTIDITPPTLFSIPEGQRGSVPAPAQNTIARMHGGASLTGAGGAAFNPVIAPGRIGTGAVLPQAQSVEPFPEPTAFGVVPGATFTTLDPRQAGPGYIRGQTAPGLPVVKDVGYRTKTAIAVDTGSGKIKFYDPAGNPIGGPNRVQAAVMPTQAEIDAFNTAGYGKGTAVNIARGGAKFDPGAGTYTGTGGGLDLDEGDPFQIGKIGSNFVVGSGLSRQGIARARRTPLAQEDPQFQTGVQEIGEGREAGRRTRIAPAAAAAAETARRAALGEAVSATPTAVLTKPQKIKRGEQRAAVEQARFRPVIDSAAGTLPGPTIQQRIQVKSVQKPFT